MFQKGWILDTATYQSLPKSWAAPSVRGNITPQSVQPQGEIPDEGREKPVKPWTLSFLFVYNTRGNIV